MSSSRRSSRSTRSARPPAWRSVSISKNSAPASLSYVVAEPEQGAPLASATSKLPAPRPARTSELDSIKDSNTHLPPSISPLMVSRPLRNDVQAVSAREDAISINGDAIPSFEESSSPPPTTPPTTPPATPPAAPEAPPAPSATTGPTVETPAEITSNAHKSPLSVPFPSSEQPADMEATPRPSSSSWFGSLSRGKGRSTMAKVKEAQQNVSPKNPAPPSIPELNTPLVQVQPPTPPQPQEVPSAEPTIEESQPTSPQSIPAHQQTKRPWFSSSPARHRGSPTTPSPLHETSIPSSIDEEVPSLSNVTLPGPAVSAISAVQPTSNGDSISRQRLSSLNPSTSRFTLSIPLLGRPKVPLGQVAAAVHSAETSADTPADIGMTLDTAAVTEAEPVPPASSSTNLTVTGVVSGDARTSADQGVDHNVMPSGLPRRETSDVFTSAASWWDYVGWSATAPVTSREPEKPFDPDHLSALPDHDTPTVDPPIDQGTLTTVVPQQSQASLEYSRDVTPNANDTQDNEPSDLTHTAPDPRPSSLLSAETTQSQGSAWYSPWAWYGYTSTVLPAGENSEPLESSTAMKTQSELVKEAALARPDDTSSTSSGVSEFGGAPSSSQSTASPPSSQPGMNPIESTIQTNRSGWVSFFSSKALIVKTITAGGEAQRDENRMEIMNLDEDDDGPDFATENVTSKDKVSGDVPKLPAAPVAAKQVLGQEQVTKRVLPPQQQKKKASPPLPEAPGTGNGKAVAPPLTTPDLVKRDTIQSNVAIKGQSVSPAPSRKSGANTPAPRTPTPNLLLPTWGDTFHALPRSFVPPPPTSKLSKTMKFVSGVLFSKDGSSTTGKAKGKERQKESIEFGKDLPRAWDVMGNAEQATSVLRGCERVVVIGIHGWFPGAVMRTVLGEPTGTSGKFVNMMVQALEEFEHTHAVKLKKITKIPLEGEGNIERRVEKLYTNLQSNQEWMDDLHAADAIFVATHSQGSIVSTHLLDRLIRDQHIRTSRNTPGVDAIDLPISGISVVPSPKLQRVCCLALCGIHLGPLRYLSSSSLLQPYIQYFESIAARELFEFQNTESAVSKAYVEALQNVLDNGTKMLYVASLNDQVVPLYSGLFTVASHPLILRALYIDGDAYHSSDFLSNLLVLLLRVMNSGISDSGLLAHLSEATAGSLNGVGHSTAYEELATYSLAVKYLFLTNDGLEEHSGLVLEPFNAKHEQNDYEIPWALRDLIADERVSHLFQGDIAELRDAFRDWHPKTTILRDIKRKLQPIQRLPSSALTTSSSKL